MNNGGVICCSGISCCCWDSYTITTTRISTDVERTKSDNCATDQQENQDDQEGEKYSEDLGTSTDFKMLPLDIFRCWNFVILDYQFLPIKEIFFLRGIDAAATGASCTIMSATIEEIVVIEVCQAVNF